MAGFGDLNFGFGVDEDENEEQEEGGGIRYWAQRDGLIFLIDASEAMFEEGGGDEGSNFHKCIKCAKNVLQNKIISSDKDFLGIVFFGTEKTKNPNESMMKHIYIFQDLEQPSAPGILALEELLDGDHAHFRKTHGHDTGYSLSDAFWVCSNMFSTCTQKLGYKRIMLFTNHDDPHRGNLHLQRQTRTKAHDLYETGIELELMHMARDGHTFDVTRFYESILNTDDDEKAALPDPADKFEELLTRVRSKDHKKRATSRIPFSLGEGLNFHVGIYNLVRSTPKPSAIKLYKKTNEEVKTVTKMFLEETAEVLMPQDLKYRLNYAGREAHFEKEEVDDVKRFDGSGLKLMGFKPIASLKRYFHVKPGSFIYPDEGTTEGSTKLFTALLKRCAARQVAPVCRFIPRRTATPVFVMLMPQEEELDENGVQMTPPGFHAVILPFCDDLRKLSYEDTPRASEDQVEKAKEVVKKLAFRYRPEAFESPTLQNYYRHLEALALDRDEPDEMTDYTLPNKQRIQKRAGALIEEFKGLVFPEGYEPGKKRRAPAGGGADTKKPKVDVSALDMKAEAQGNRLGKLTVPVLKQFAKDTGIKVSGTKKDNFVEAIKKHFGVD